MYAHTTSPSNNTMPLIPICAKARNTRKTPALMKGIPGQIIQRNSAHQNQCPACADDIFACLPTPAGGRVRNHADKKEKKIKEEKEEV